MAVFTWTPDLGASEDRQPRVLTVQFGDGYSQRVADGLNSDLRKHSLTFSGRGSSESSAIIAFLEDAAGADSFTYTHPGGSALTYICPSWKVTDVDYGLRTITAEFQQVVG